MTSSPHPWLTLHSLPAPGAQEQHDRLVLTTGVTSSTCMKGASDVPDGFAGVLLKVDRADHHLRVLDRCIKSFLQRHPYRIIGKVEPTNREPRPHTVYRVTISEQPPVAIGCLIGDAVHNLRSALDHIAWMLPRDPRPNDEEIQFPIWTERFHVGSPKLAGLSPEAVEAIKGLQPFPRPDGGQYSRALATILQLSNFDKHREVVVGGMVPKSLGWYSAGAASADVIYFHSGPFLDDAVVMEFAAHSQVSTEPVLTPSVAVAKPETMAGEVLPDRLQLAASFVRDHVIPAMLEHL
jgi:hypothetical protein